MTEMIIRTAVEVKGKEALVVEPHEECRSMFSDLLEFADYVPTQVSSLEEAIEHLEKNSYDVVVTSLLSLCEKGSRLIELLKESSPRPKVVIAYADMNKAKEEAHEELGFGDLLDKTRSPIGMLQLIEEN